MPDTENSIICKGQAGLGNRILCLLTCILYAKLSKRTLIVDWRDEAYSDNVINIFPYLFTSASILSSIEYDCSNSVNPKIWEGNLELSVLDLCRKTNIEITRTNGPSVYKQYSISLNNVNYKNDIVIFSSYTHKLRALRKHFTGEFSLYSGQSYNDILRTLISEELIPSVEVSNRVETFVKRYLQKPTLGVHIRYTDRSTPLDTFHSKIRKAMANKEDFQLFLACDNKLVQRDFESRYGNIITTDKWLPEPGERIHYNPNRPTGLSVAVDAIVDMYLLSKCHYLIYPGRSTFSFISYLLSGLPDDKVVDIDKWNFYEKLKRLIHTIA